MENRFMLHILFKIICPQKEINWYSLVCSGKKDYEWQYFLDFFFVQNTIKAHGIFVATIYRDW